MTDSEDRECSVDRCEKPNGKWSIYCREHYKEIKEND